MVVVGIGVGVGDSVGRGVSSCSADTTMGLFVVTEGLFGSLRHCSPVCVTVLNRDVRLVSDTLSSGLDAAKSETLTHLSGEPTGSSPQPRVTTSTSIPASDTVNGCKQLSMMSNRTSTNRNFNMHAFFYHADSFTSLYCVPLFPLKEYITI